MEGWFGRSEKGYRKGGWKCQFYRTERGNDTGDAFDTGNEGANHEFIEQMVYNQIDEDFDTVEAADTLDYMETVTYEKAEEMLNESA